MAQPAPKSSGARNLVILVLLAAVSFGLWYYFERTGTVIIGTKDNVIYSGLATQSQATALGNALKTIGYFQDSGFSALLRKPIGGSMIISFVVKDGGWNDAAEVSDFESLTRDVASSVGGLPVEMRLVNSTEIVEKDETVTAQTGTQPPTQPGTQPPTQPGAQPGTSSTVTIGTKDQVIYSGTATQAQATALGNELKTEGYFQDRGVTVELNIGANGTTISFVVGDGVWNQKGMMGQFEELGREVASTVGGLPVTVQLMDTQGNVHKTGVVGVAQLTGGDAVYYEGYSTLADAQALGQKLQAMGYFTGKGANVFLKKHTSGTTLAFVVADGTWNNATMVGDFETITRSVAPTIGGLPIDMRLLSTTLVVEKDETIK
ncbi:MAG: hypothetical protein ABSD20_12240 [Terriglobales bacterium]|jgi:hypothetical protein